MHFSTLVVLFGALIGSCSAFPTQEARDEGVAAASWISDITLPGLPPTALKNNGTKKVYDLLHPFIPPGPFDIRGPCPGLNTLANHGYLPRNGIATPAQIIKAVMEGFNMELHTARFVAYAAFVVDGNPITDLISIGGKDIRTGLLPAPAIVGGLNTHGVFEGDASTTRLDANLGDNASLDPGLWDQFVDYTNRYGGGYYNLTVAQELRYRRNMQSIAENPKFDFTSPRYFTAYAESTFPYVFFADGRIPRDASGVSTGAPLADLTEFFVNNRFPRDFYRAPGPSVPSGIVQIFLAHPILPGRNQDAVNTYTVDPNSGSFTNFCNLYYNFLNQTLKTLYPNPTGILKRNLAINLRWLYQSLPSLPGQTEKCTELFPYGVVDVDALYK